MSKTKCSRKITQSLDDRLLELIDVGCDLSDTLKEVKRLSNYWAKRPHSGRHQKYDDIADSITGALDHLRQCTAELEKGIRI